MRQRMIRPEFFADADLADLPPVTRLLFIGLWTLADREGRLRDKPRSIKLALLPMDEFDVDAALAQLAEIGSIRRYEADGQYIIDIPKFSSYQHLHWRESPSTLPPFKFHRAKKVAISREASGQPQASPLPASVKPVASASASALNILSDKAPSDGGFEDFWSKYPNKQGKDVARKKWRKLSPNDRSSALIVAVAMAAVVASGRRESQFCPGGAVFINQRRWEDWADGPPAGYEPNGNGSKTTYCPKDGVELVPDGDGSGHMHCPVCS